MKTSSARHETINESKSSNKMDSVIIRRFFVISITLAVYANIFAQAGLTIYTDLGENNVSDGLFIKSAILGHLKFGKNSIETGFETNLRSDYNPFLSGYVLSVSRILQTKGSSFEIRGFGTWTRNSEFLRETNWGTLLNMRHKRFKMALGTNFRTYAFRDQAVTDYKIGKNDIKLHEKFNVMYSFAYYLKKDDNLWNTGLSLTNTDHFYISQETNAMLCLNGFYNPGSRVSLFAEAWYKSAGAPNLAINYFGFFFRTGMTWNFN